MSRNYDNVFVACDWSDLPLCPVLASLGSHRLPWLDANDDDDDEGESRLCSTMVVDEQIVCCERAVPSSLLRRGLGICRTPSNAPLNLLDSLSSRRRPHPTWRSQPLCLIFLATQCARSYPLGLSFFTTSTLSSVNSAVTVARCDSEPSKPADPTAYTLASGRYHPTFFFFSFPNCGPINSCTSIKYN